MFRILFSLFLVTVWGPFALADDFSNLGWPTSLSDLYYKLESKPTKNYFIVISRLPSIAVDFRSAEGLHNSINSFTFQKNYHPGHEIIGWKCRVGDARFETMLGLTGESSDQHNELLATGWGLSSLLATFKDGFVQMPGEIENRLKYFLEENKKAELAGEKPKIFLMSTVIEISEDDCQSIVNESFEFIDHPNNPTQNFSMILSPEKYEGAGCGSFAAHFMERISGLKDLIPHFRRQYDLPNYLFGTGTYLPSEVEIPDKIKNIAVKKPVSKIKLIASPWTSTASPNVNVEILDPELLVFWQKLFFDAYFDQKHWTKEKKSFNKLVARGIWDRSEDVYNSGQTQMRYVSIDKNYDGHTNRIDQLHSSFVQGANLSYFTFLNFPGIILERK